MSGWLDDFDVDLLSQYITRVTPPRGGIGFGGGGRSLDTPSPLPMMSPRPAIGVGTGSSSSPAVTSGGPTIGVGTNPPPTTRAGTSRPTAGYKSTPRRATTAGKRPRRVSRPNTLSSSSDSGSRRRSSRSSGRGSGGGGGGGGGSSGGGSDDSTPPSSASSGPPRRRRRRRRDRVLNQAEMQQQLEQILQDQQQTAAGRRIAGIMTTNTITTTYKDNRRPTVTRNSTSVRNLVHLVMRSSVRRRRQRAIKTYRQMGGAVGLVRALAAPFTKKAATGLVKAVARRAAKGAAIGAASAGMRYGARKVMKKIRNDDDESYSRKMLRSEVRWFPKFIILCRHSYASTSEQSMDHEDMTRVVEECKGFRDVQTLLNRSTETAFKDEIWTYQQLAKSWLKKIERAEMKLKRLDQRRVRLLRWLQESRKNPTRVSKSPC